MAAPKTPRDRCGGDARCARWLLPGLAWLAAAAASAQPMPVTWQRSWSAAGGASEESAMVRALPEGSMLTLVSSHGVGLSLLRHAGDGTPGWVREGLVDAQAGELVVLPDGDAVVAAIDGPAARLVVLRLDGGTGATVWQYRRPLAGLTALSHLHGARLAHDPVHDRLRVAVADFEDWRILDLDGDGAAGPELVSGAPDRIDLPVAVIARAGGVVVSGYEVDTPSTSAIRTVAFAADGRVRYVDHEPGALGSLFVHVPIALAADDAGGHYVLASMESTCGLHQALLWRLQADGVRRWRRAWPDDPCRGFIPVALLLHPGGSPQVAGQMPGARPGIGAIRFDAHGQRLWQRAWRGSDGQQAQAEAAALGPDGRLRVVGSARDPEAPPGRLRGAIVEWTAEGTPCHHGHLDGIWGATAIATLGDDWAVAAIGPGSGSDAFLQRQPGATACSADALFADGYEGETR